MVSLSDAQVSFQGRCCSHGICSITTLGSTDMSIQGQPDLMLINTLHLGWTKRSFWKLSSFLLRTGSQEVSTSLCSKLLHQPASNHGLQPITAQNQKPNNWSSCCNTTQRPDCQVTTPSIQGLAQALQVILERKWNQDREKLNTTATIVNEKPENLLPGSYQAS